jgi:hypothetical protein
MFQCLFKYGRQAEIPRADYGVLIDLKSLLPELVSVHVQRTSQYQVIQFPITNIYKLQNRYFISSLDTRVDTLF